MKTETMVITPEMAVRWLTGNNPLNRNLRKPVVEKYASDMRNGLWRKTHQGIAFYEDGTVADGQHRLNAIVSAGIPVEMLVTTGMAKDVGEGIDQHSVRAIHDAMKFGNSAKWMHSKDTVALIRFMMDGMGVGKVQASPGIVAEYAMRHEPAIKFAASLVTTKRANLTTAGVLACYACAFLAGEPTEKLARFAHIMISGEISGPTENAAIRLREHLLSSNNPWTGPTRAANAKKTQRAIKAFCDGQPLAKLMQPEGFTYPCPAL